LAGCCRRGERKEKRLVAALFLFFGLNFFISADQYIGQIILEKTSFLVNEEFKLSILIPELAPAQFSITAPSIPEGLSIVNGPFIRPGRNGSIVDYYLLPVKEGRFIIESFKVKTAEKTQLTIPVFITAANTFQIMGRFDKVPPIIKWNIPDERYFPGEIIPLQFIIENIETSDLMIETAVRQKQEGYVRKISSSADKNEKQIFAKEVMTGEIYDVSFHDHIFTAIKPGETLLPDVEIFLSKGSAGYRTVLKGIPIFIDKAPGTDSGTGAIGDFIYKYEISDNTISDDKPVVIKLKITGRGNFFGINIPLPFTDNPEFAEITLIKDQSDIAPEGNLFRGYREITCLLKRIKNPVNKNMIPEKLILTIPDFTWFEESYFKLPPGMGFKRAPGVKKEIDFLYNIPVTSDILPESPASLFQGRVAVKLMVIIFVLLLVPAVFFISRKTGKKIFIVSVILSAAAAALFLIYRLVFSPPVYGELKSDSGSNVPVYSIPEIDGNIKTTLEGKTKVSIIDSKDSFYLIKLPEMEEEGWIDKKNIILE